LVALAAGGVALADDQPCARWVAPAPIGNDTNPGTAEQPWASFQHAADVVPDAGCIVWVATGTYPGGEIDRRFASPMTFRAADPYRAVLVSTTTVLALDGASNVVIQGFDMHQAGPGSTGLVVYVDAGGGMPTDHVVLRDNVIHDSYDNDLVKLRAASRFLTIEGNVFFNQGPIEQHLDVNSVTDVVIRDNVFFNDFARSGRVDPGTTKHFIVIKDSNQATDGLLGSERIAVRRNVFLNWQGGQETLVKVGNDGEAYFEAKDVRVENNLMVGNSSSPLTAAFGIDGAKDVVFDANTVVGDLPGKAYAFRVSIKGQNPPNESIRFVGNIWSDPTGTMGLNPPSASPSFSTGSPSATSGLVLDDNLYWNGGQAIPSGALISPLVADARRVVADPGLRTDHAAVVVPYWTGSVFLGGGVTIRDEFLRLVETYAMIPPGSAAVGAGDPALMPTDDILGLPRDGAPDLGAYEIREASSPPPSSPPPTSPPATSPPPTSPPPTSPPPPPPPGPPTGLVVLDPATGGALDLSWSANIETDLVGYLVYRSTDPAAPKPWTRLNGAPAITTAYGDTGLTNGTSYSYYVTALSQSGDESAPSSVVSATPTRTPVILSYNPNAVTISRGVAAGDPLGAMASDDATPYRVNAVKQSKKYVTDWYASTSVAPGATRLTLTYDGSTSATASQTLYVYRWSTSSWVQVDTRSVGTTDVTIMWPTTSPSTYVSSSGVVRVRVATTGSAAHAVRVDLVRCALEY
jgi:hypothetical protein